MHHVTDDDRREYPTSTQAIGTLKSQFSCCGEAKNQGWPAAWPATASRSVDRLSPPDTIPKLLFEGVLVVPFFTRIIHHNVTATSPRGLEVSTLGGITRLRCGASDAGDRTPATPGKEVRLPKTPERTPPPPSSSSSLP